MTKTELLKAALLAVQSLCADDKTKPGTLERQRHMRGVMTLHDLHDAVAKWMPDGAEV